MVRESFTSGSGLRRRPGHVFADELVVGMRIIPPGKVRPVTIEAQFTDPEATASTFKFLCSSPHGWSALVLQRSAQVRIVPKRETTSPEAGPPGIMGA